MKTIMIKGYGGQGISTLGVLISQLLTFNKFNVVGYPHFGPERRGSPINYYIRYSKKKILDKFQFTNAELTIIFDKESRITINNSKGISKIGINNNIFAFGFITKKLNLDKKLAIKMLVRKSLKNQKNTFNRGFKHAELLL